MWAITFMTTFPARLWCRFLHFEGHAHCHHQNPTASRPFFCLTPPLQFPRNVIFRFFLYYIASMVFEGLFATVVPQPGIVFTKWIQWNNAHSYILFTPKVCPSQRHSVTMTIILSVAIALPCTGAGIIDLATVKNPFTGSTAGNADEVSVCGTGPDQGFALLLVPEWASIYCWQLAAFVRCICYVMEEGILEVQRFPALSW